VHDNDKYWSAIFRGTPQIYLSGWGANYPGAGGFIDDDLRCSAPGTAVALCTKSIDAEVQEAQQLQATDPAAANRAWTEIEHQLVQEAVWAPLTNPLSAYAFSARMENIQVHPEWGILLSRLWVH
jgi:peptide/nickel transport system substrate-binding protein